METAAAADWLEVFPDVGAGIRLLDIVVGGEEETVVEVLEVARSDTGEVD